MFKSPSFHIGIVRSVRNSFLSGVSESVWVSFNFCGVRETHRLPLGRGQVPGDAQTLGLSVVNASLERLGGPQLASGLYFLPLTHVIGRRSMYISSLDASFSMHYKELLPTIMC